MKEEKPTWLRLAEVHADETRRHLERAHQEVEMAKKVNSYAESLVGKLHEHWRKGKGRFHDARPAQGTR